MKDENESFKKVSKVSGNEKFNKAKSHMIWLVVMILVGLICVILLTSGKHKKPSNDLTSDHSFLLSNHELEDNLTKLNASKVNDDIILNHYDQDFLPKTPLQDKGMMVRQNAPTEMYNAIPQAAHYSRSQDSVKEAVLSDGSSNAEFANQESTVTTVAARRMPHPAYTIAEGEFIHAILETAVNSDLPGMVRAVISEPVYAYTGEHALIPAGARLIGQYDSGVIQGQSRVMIIWNRVILPNGVSVLLDSPGTDALGRAGQNADTMNRHFLARFGNASLLSLIGAGAASYGVNPQDQYNSASLYRAAIAQSFQQSANQSLEQSQPIKPTLNIYQGAEINVFVAHDLSFYQVMHGIQQ